MTTPNPTPIPVPVPVDAAEVTVRLLGAALAARADDVVAGVKVSTETGRNPEGGPPSLPWLLVRADGGAWSWPAVERVTLGLTCWHTSEYRALALCRVAVAVLCCPSASGAVIAVEPVASPVPGVDPYTAGPLATATIALTLRVT